MNPGKLLPAAIAIGAIAALTFAVSLRYGNSQQGAELSGSQNSDNRDNPETVVRAVDERIRGESDLERRMLEMVRNLENPEAHFNPLTYVEQVRMHREELLLEDMDVYELANSNYVSFWTEFVNEMDLSATDREFVREALTEYERARPSC